MIKTFREFLLQMCLSVFLVLPVCVNAAESVNADAAEAPVHTKVVSHATKNPTNLKTLIKEVIELKKEIRELAQEQSAIKGRINLMVDQQPNQAVSFNRPGLDIYPYSYP